MEGVPQPKELVYSQWLTDWVLKLKPQASELLRIAARGQHIGRWEIPRNQYGSDRGGYLRWREALKKLHAQKVLEIMQKAGYSAEEREKVRNIIVKKDIKRDSDTQVIEDALCLVFLETQFEALRKKTPSDKMKTVLRKTWQKMSSQAHNMALQLNLGTENLNFIKEALSL